MAFRPLKAPPNSGQMGFVYLLHYARTIGSGQQKTRHYRGWTRALDSGRLECHAAGNGARLPAAFARQDIEFTVARTWEGDRNRERQIKNQGSAVRQCPLCNPGMKRLKTT
jgi:hypothetical protein